MEYNHSIELSEPAGSGYQWLPIKNGKYLVKSKEYAEVSDPSEQIGGSVKVRFNILALTQEPFDVLFELKRPFESEVVDVKLFKFNQ